MGLAAQFAEVLEQQAPDWSDIYFTLRLPDEARLDEARLSMAPAQLERVPGERTLFTFHVSQKQGYGAFPKLAQSCLQKLDDRMIGGVLDVTQVLHGVQRNWTQGPVLG